MSTCFSCAALLELDAAFCGQCGARVRTRRSTLVGTQLDGRFAIDAKIAEGGFGSIYRATHLASRHSIALKVLHPELAADESLAARFRREGETLSSLRSPHTVSVFEVGEAEDGTLYIAMELLHGESLLDRFRSRGPLAWRDVLSIMKQVCRSLGEAHALGIVHRDLKPANIQLEAPTGERLANDHVKVLDFGIAKLMRGSDSDDGNDLTRVGQAVGTLEYMAPEQLIGAACDGRADIYALGVVVYEILTGRRPYEEATGPTSLVAAVMTQPLIPPSKLFGCACIPPAVDELVLRCLAKEPKHRFATVGALIAAIDAIDAIDAIAVPLARGSWSNELLDEDEPTWIDRVPTPRSQPVQYAQSDIAFEATHMQPAVVSPVTDPNLVPVVPAPVTRTFPRGSSSPVSTVSPVTHVRARRESDVELQTPPKYALAPLPFRELPAPPAMADGSSVDQPPFVEQPARAPAPETTAQTATPISALRVALWTVGLLVGGSGLGMLIASLFS